MAEQRLDQFNAQGLANTAWAFATVGQKDEQLFKALAKMAEQRLDEFNAQGLANTAWAFATVGAPAPALLDPISVLDVMEGQGSKPQLMYYAMSMQGLATTGKVEAGFALLERAEAKGLLSNSNNEGYPMFHNLLQACRLVGDFNGASRVQAAMDRLGLIALAPVATAVV